ncbi:insulinase family protein [Candidatus Microgenomates bacterium]|nr:insulinase family protein [Candidatus Microgenomates bacterium]
MAPKVWFITKLPTRRIYYDKIQANPASPEELRRAKDYSKGKMVLALEDTFRVASFYTHQELLRKEIETPDEVLEKIEKVTVEDIQRVAKDIFKTEKLNLALVGPFKDPEQFDTLLKV